MDLSFGTWNVRTLYRPGAQRELFEELKRYKIGVAAVQETRWLGNGVRDTKTHTVLYSGREKGKRELGVAFVVDRNLKHLIVDFHPVNERICRIRLATKFFNLSIINVHCPTDEKDEDIKAEFYQLLEKIYDTAPKNDIKLIMGDMNAKIGKEDAYLGTIGRHSLHNESNRNGELLIDFATSRNMVISSTQFPHRDIHKGTWVAPDGKTVNQIDHVIIDKRAATSIIDVKTRRGASVGSDHYMVQMKFRCRVAVYRKDRLRRQEKVNTVSLKDPERVQEYAGKVRNRLNESVAGTVEEKWQSLKCALLETCLLYTSIYSNIVEVSDTQC